MAREEGCYTISTRCIAFGVTHASIRVSRVNWSTYDVEDVYSIITAGRRSGIRLWLDSGGKALSATDKATSCQDQTTRGIRHPGTNYT